MSPYKCQYNHRKTCCVKHRNSVGSIRTSFPIPISAEFFYFEIKIENGGKKSDIAIGLTQTDTRLNSMPGWKPFTIGYHGYNGKVYYEFRGKEYGATFGTGDVVGCGIDLTSETVFFTKNGLSYGIAKQNLPQRQWYPTICLHSKNEVVEINFGQKPFVYKEFDDYGKEYLL